MFEIEGVGWTQILLLMLLAGFSLLIAVVLWNLRHLDQRVALALYAGMAVCVAVAGLMVWFAIGQLRSAVEIVDDRLELRVQIYGRGIPISSILVDSAEIVSTGEPSPYRTVLRTNALGLPGYQLGWFNTADKGPALVAITSRQALALPTTDGFSLIISVGDHEGLLASIRDAQQRSIE